jgi:primosomal protein N''
VGRRFIKLAGKLRPRLGILRIQVRSGRGNERPSFRQVTSELIRRHAAELGDNLKAVRTAENMAEVHEARIAAKRLRYLLEPLTRRAPGAKGLTAPLKGLQDVLGHLHDMHVISEEIASSLAALSRSPMERASGVESGLSALEQVANEQGAAAFASFEAHWMDQHGSRFFARVDELGRTLTGTADNAAEALPGLSLMQNPRSEPASSPEHEKTRRKGQRLVST